ncbi:hypothetical protein B0H14DRAFT_3174000 [Mycena olivaceomarginata]|nr:hypothetical protein B0H14DRAFT_3174000 [Mycena olivaceomarginata]
MLNALWQFVFPPKPPTDPPPLQRPRKYPRTQNAPFVPTHGLHEDARANEHFEGLDFANGPQLQPHPLPFRPEQYNFPPGISQNWTNPQAFYGTGFNPWLANFSAPYHFHGPSPHAGPYHNQWNSGFNPPYPFMPPQFAPPAYPPPLVPVPPISGPSFPTPAALFAVPPPVQPDSSMPAVKDVLHRSNPNVPASLLHGTCVFVTETPTHSGFRARPHTADSERFAATLPLANTRGARRRPMGGGGGGGYIILARSHNWNNQFTTKT